MRAPTRIDPSTGDDDECARLYHPDPVDPPWPEVTIIDPADGLLGADGNPITERIPFGFQPPEEHQP